MRWRLAAAHRQLPLRADRAFDCDTEIDHIHLSGLQLPLRAGRAFDCDGEFPLFAKNAFRGYKNQRKMISPIGNFAD